jgi:CRISPR-associated protein Csy3
MTDNLDKIKTASVLAFERKLDPSDALFYAGNWDDRSNSKSWPAIVIREKAVRGTISNRFKTKDSDPAKLDAKAENPNLQTVDVATLSNNCDTLKVSFTLRILGNVGKPSVCNSSEYSKKLTAIVKSYIDKHGFKELAQRYAYNLANGRFLWRNRVGAEDIDIRIHHQAGGAIKKTFQFDAFQFSLRDFEIKSEVKASGKKDLEELSTLIESGLQGKGYTLLMVEAYVRIGSGQEVFPSQELVIDQVNSQKKGGKSKVLYMVNDVAAIHSQKIGNAVRTVDNWYQVENGEEHVGPISVEPYGSVTTLGHAYRHPKQKMDFYSLLDNWVLKDKLPEASGNQHFVMANLIRGGVFGESSKE